MTTPKRDVSSRRVLLIRTAPAVVEPEARAIRFSGPGFEGLRTAGSAPWFDGHPPPTPVSGPSSDREIGRLTNAFWNQRAGGVLGTLEMFPTGVTSAADRQRGLIPGGSDRLSIRYYPIGENGQVRGADGVVDVLRWGVSHVASVGEPADVSAGDELGSADGYDLEVHLIDMEGDMTQNLDLNTALPLIANAVAEGVKLANQPTDTGGQEPMLAKMLEIAVQQKEIYPPAGLGELALDVAQNKITSADDLRSKLESIRIIPKPSAAGLGGDGGPSGADYSQMLCSWWNGQTLRGDAWREAEDVMGQSKVRQMAAPGAIPLTMQAISAIQNSLVATSAASSAGDAVDTGVQVFYDSVDRDPLNLWDLVDQIPGGAGEVKLTEITMPTPTWLPEPTADAGYARGTDVSADENSLTPKLLISYVTITRVLDVLQPQFWSEIAMIAQAAMLEQINAGLIETANSDAPVGMYNFTGVGSSPNLTVAPTAAQVGSVLEASALSSYGNRRLVLQHGAWQSLRSQARPAGVAPLVDPAGGRFGSIDSVGLEVTGLWTDAKPFRGVAGPWQNIAARLWDSSFYLSERYEAGVRWLLVEAFVDWRPRHPELFSRLRQN